ncbi:hypothetical protein B0H63DRAFT_490169 [Podospora didyma]|uniref:Uncharacterized protein n=1 Tax=Podospora didyma TaxID=330526 RepID=A0AAE0K1N0_9PEZI|nr:hypothetical protein B0H63DRAFT_490169 [Podospora didyma]
MPESTAATMINISIRWPASAWGVVLAVIRATQFCTISISCFCVGYLITMHNHHYCAYYNCGTYSGHLASVPVGEAMMLIACVLVTLEFLYSTGITILMLSRQKRPNSFGQLCSAWTSVALLTIGLGSFASIADVRKTWPMCHSQGIFEFSIYFPVELNMCIVTQSALTTGLIAWGATLLIALLAVRELKMDHGQGAIRLPFSSGRQGQEDVAAGRGQEEQQAGDAVAIEDIETV